MPPTFSLTPSRRRMLTGMLGAAAATILPGTLRAQTYPSRPIRLLVPVSAGGGTDLIARVVADATSRVMSQSWVVENQAGAGGQIATQALARSEPDGHHLMIGYVSTHGTLPALRDVPFDPVADFTRIAMIGGAPNVLVCNAGTGPKTFSEFLSQVRAAPGKASFGSAGVGTITHLVFEHLKIAADIDVLHVPYRGIAPAINDLMAGQIGYSMPGMAGAIAGIRSGKLRALAVSGRARHRLLPDIPTFQEQGLAGFEALQWVGIMGPAGLPEPITQILNASINKALSDPALEDKLSTEGIEIMPMSPQEFAHYAETDLNRWHEVVKVQGLRTGSKQ